MLAKRLAGLSEIDCDDDGPPQFSETASVQRRSLRVVLGGQLAYLARFEVVYLDVVGGRTLTIGGAELQRPARSLVIWSY